MKYLHLERKTVTVEEVVAAATQAGLIVSLAGAVAKLVVSRSEITPDRVQCIHCHHGRLIDYRPANAAGLLPENHPDIKCADCNHPYWRLTRNGRTSRDWTDLGFRAVGEDNNAFMENEDDPGRWGRG